MLKVLAFLTKRKGLETQELIDYYENHHVPFVLSLVSATPLVYKRNYRRAGRRVQSRKRSTRLRRHHRAGVLGPSGVRQVDRGTLGRGDRSGRRTIPRSIADEGVCHRGARDTRLRTGAIGPGATFEVRSRPRSPVAPLSEYILSGGEPDVGRSGAAERVGSSVWRRLRRGSLGRSRRQTCPGVRQSSSSTGSGC